MHSHPKISQPHIPLLIICISVCFFFLPLHGGLGLLETDTITFNTSLRDPQTIISSNHQFKLGFYSPENTTNRYMAVFFAFSESEIVWIANRDRPLKDSSGVITLSDKGNLVLVNGDSDVVWSTNIVTAGDSVNRSNVVVRILDTGNVVLYDNSSGDGEVIWDSFSHPTNVWLPKMALTDDTRTGNKVTLTSWKNASNPMVGSYIVGLQAMNIPQLFIWHSDGRPCHRTGYWNGHMFTGEIASYQTIYSGGFSVSETSSGIFSLFIPTIVEPYIFFVNEFGNLNVNQWNDQNNSWTFGKMMPGQECDVYGKCGPFGLCDDRTKSVLSCSCMRGFEPAHKEEWDRGNWTSGCVRKTQLYCNKNDSFRGKEKEDGFLRMRYVKLPDFAEKLEASTDEEDCRIRCLQNCSCIAYAYDLNHIGCMLWWERDEGLIDTEQFPGVGLDLHVRLAASELDDGKGRRLLIVSLVIGVTISMLVLVFIARCLVVRIKGKTKERNGLSHSTAIFLQDVSERSVRIKELPLFAYNTLAIATNHFHDSNLLGKGGFGHVYKGQLKNGKEIAVKRLYEASSQGVEEFTNEVLVISKLQHTNLVRLMGCCVEKEEKMLVYEYLPNKSLDVCLFGLPYPSGEILDGGKRLNIIKGIGRGLLYLHRDSRLKIIHRDLKASNVLLDQEWNPKISDFGRARIFEANQDQANTIRVVGTYGYMAPEYATDGIFSDKSDVYSFGVLMLEIVSGKKNTNYYDHELSLSLLGCAWKFWKEGNGVAFLDQSIQNSTSREELVRCIHIALLCVHEFAEDRPPTQNVLSMLEGEVVDLPMPEQPLFANKWICTR